MRNRIRTTAQKLKLLYKDREIGGNLVLWSFIKFLTGPNKVKQAAAALTYHTLFALVPVMAMMIAVANLMATARRSGKRWRCFSQDRRTLPMSY